MKALAPVIGLIQMCVFLAGTVVVFGKLGIYFHLIHDKNVYSKTILYDIIWIAYISIKFHWFKDGTVLGVMI